MVMTIDFASEVPIYQQIYTQVEQGIASGELKEGEQLPTVRQLAVDIGINMHTVHKAYGLLKEDGYILLNRRRGAVVAGGQRAKEEDIAYIESTIRSAAARAVAKKMPRDAFISLCERIYNQIEEGTTNE